MGTLNELEVGTGGAPEGTGGGELGSGGGGGASCVGGPADLEGLEEGTFGTEGAAAPGTGGGPEEGTLGSLNRGTLGALAGTFPDLLSLTDLSFGMPPAKISPN